MGDGVLAAGAFAEIHAVVDSEYGTAPLPAGFAVFSRHGSAGGLHCDVEAFFSPAAAALARRLGAAPCPTPVRDGLELVVGEPGSLDRLLAEDASR